ncbi:MAG: M23 family metallopeptidase [SAR202 cluster bacterium]|nr:M23 family metallopeptidase [SAR202 cluster bacterium]
MTLTLYVRELSIADPVVPGAQVTGTTGNGAPFNQSANSSGYVTLTGAPGTWQFAISAVGFTSRTWNDTITTSQTRTAFFSSKVTATPVIAAQVVSYAPANLATKPIGTSVSLSVTIRNTGNTPWNFTGGLTIFDDAGVEVASYSAQTGSMAPIEERTLIWDHVPEAAGDYWVQFGAWKQQSFIADNLLHRYPSPSRNLIRATASESCVPLSSQQVPSLERPAIATLVGFKKAQNVTVASRSNSLQVCSAPIVSRVSPPSDTISLNVGESITFIAQVTAHDGNLSGVAWRINGELVSAFRFEAIGSRQDSLPRTFTDVGTLTVTVTYLDTSGIDGDIAWTVTVEETPSVCGEALGFQMPIANNLKDPTQAFALFLPDYNGKVYQGFHGGEDWSADPGQSVYPIAKGRIAKISPLGALGHLIAIEHTGSFLFPDYATTTHGQSVHYSQENVNTFYSVYIHVTPGTGLIEGQCVNQGDAFASIATLLGSHLHLEIRHPDQIHSRNWSLVGDPEN